MKKIKKILLILTALFSMAFLAGCEKSAQIGTTLTLDKDFKGERAMHVEISKESFAENVTGTMEDIQAIFAESCPEELTYEFAETENSYTVDIHLAFDSEEDYYNKVKAITEQEEPGDITISSSVFHSGISVSESFESKDLLKWLSDALIEKQFVSADNESNIFDYSGCVVKYEGEEYASNSNSYVRIDESVSTELSRIRIKTSLNLDGTWNREISFYVPKASMDANGDAISEFLEDGVAKGAEGSWESYSESGEKGQVYTIKAESIPVETMEKLVQKAFHTEESTVTDQTETMYGGESSSNLIRSSAFVSESYDLSEFVSESSSSLQIEYVVEENGTENPSTGYVYGAEYSIDRQFDTYLLPTGINLTSKVTGVNKYNRTFEFTFEGLEDEEKEFLKSQAENLAKDLGKVSIKDKKDVYTLTFTAKGDRETVGKLYEKLFGQEMSANYAAEHKWMGFTNTFAYEEYINLSSFLPYGTGQTVDVNYELSFGTGAKISSKLENAFEAKGSTLYLSGSTSSSISVSLYGTRTNVRGIISMFVLLLGIASLVFFVILLLTGKAKKKKAEQAPAPVTQVSEAPAQPVEPAPEAPAQPASASADEQPQTADLPAFCTGCGEKFENDEIMFCVKCGKKRGE